jgi:hypothetical protein
LNSSNKRFEVALSFPGEYREFVAKTAELLAEKLGPQSVLYDKYHEAEFARPNLDIHLPNLYRTESELITVFLCAEYAQKRWCSLEWRSIRQLISTAEEDRIMFLSFDRIGTVPELGILSGDGYVFINQRSPQEIVGLILNRLGSIHISNRSGGSESTVAATITYDAILCYHSSAHSLQALRGASSGCVGFAPFSFPLINKYLCRKSSLCVDALVAGVELNLKRQIFNRAWSLIVRTVKSRPDFIYPMNHGLCRPLCYR